MGRTNYFQFKQFKVVQEKAAMKVGMDGVLLGAWASLETSNRILDVGTGTGLLALMAAQKSEACIDAVEIDRDAADDAQENFNHSKWAGRFQLFQLPIQEFSPDYQFDHIISNPPFFENSVKSKDEKRLKARHSDSLSLQELLEKAVNLLAEDGKISLILPTDKEKRLQQILPTLGLFMNRLTYVAPDEFKKPHRILVEMSRSLKLLKTEAICLRVAGTNNYSDDYMRITRDFYLSW